MKSFRIRFSRNKQEKRFKSFIDKVQKQDAWKNEAADLAIKNIKLETRKGKYIKDGSAQKPLSSAWIDKKRELAKNNAKGVSFSAAKSNLTVTGQLLESLKRTDDRKRVILTPTGKRRGYINKNNRRAKASSTPTNKELAGYLKDQGRSFLGYSDKLKKAVTKVFKEAVRRNLKDLNKN